MLVAGYDLEGQRLVYSTSEIRPTCRRAATSLLLYGRDGEDGETVLRYASEPTVEVLDGTVDQHLRRGEAATCGSTTRTTAWPGCGSPAAAAPLTLLLADDDDRRPFWRQDTSAGPVLVRGPELVRTAADHRRDAAR